MEPSLTYLFLKGEGKEDTNLTPPLKGEGKMECQPDKYRYSISPTGDEHVIDSQDFL
jgi:hypothetical protein